MSIKPVKIYVLLKDSTTNETGSEVRIGKEYTKGADELLIQIDIAGGAHTVELQGRITGQAGWVTIFSGKTASEIIPIAWVPFLRVVTTGAGSPLPSTSVYAVVNTD